jgi:hypothetical protein
MNTKRMVISTIVCLLLGIGLIVAAGMTELDNSFWPGMGGGLVAVAILRLVRMIRFAKSDEYRKEFEVENKDERNRFLSAKAWSWAGYLFVMISAVATIVLQVLGQEMWSMATSGALCLVLVLYWVSYLIVRKKY